MLVTGGSSGIGQAIAVMNAIDVGIRAFDPCLSCATHAFGQMPLIVTVRPAVSTERTVEVRDPDLTVDPIYGGPEYETLTFFGSMCGVGDLKLLSKASADANVHRRRQRQIPGRAQFQEPDPLRLV